MTILHPCCQLLPIVPDHYKNLAAIQQNRTEIDLAENKEVFFFCQFLYKPKQFYSQVHHFLVQDLELE